MLPNVDFKKLLTLESKDAALYTLVTFITGLGSFLMVPLFWTKLTPTDYGIIAVTEILGAFLGSFTGLSLDQGQTRFYHEWPEEERKERTGTLWLTSWISNLIISLLISIIIYPISKYIFPDLNFFPFIFYGILITILSGFGTFPMATIRIMQLTKIYVAYRLVFFSFSMAFNILFILVLNEGVLGYFYGSIISGLAMFVFYIVLMIRNTKINISLSHIIEPLKFSLPMIPSTLVGTITGQVDRFLLQQYVDLNTLGLYSVSLKFAGLITQLHTALKLSFGPFVYKTLIELKDDGKELLSKMTSFYLFPIFVLAFIISISIDDFVIWVNRASYNGIINVVPFLCYITMISCLYVYMAPGIVLSKRTKLLIIPVIAQLVSLVIFSIWLLPRFEIYGLIITKFLSGLTFLTVSLVISNRVYDWRPQYKMIINFLLISVVLLMIRKAIPEMTFLINLMIDLIFIVSFIIYGAFLLKKTM